MADRPAPVTDLAWSPEQARELGAGVLDLWTELLERLPDELVTRERAPLDTAAALALPVPEEPMPTEDVLAYLRELTFEQSLHMGHPALLRLHHRRGDHPRRGGGVPRRRAQPVLGRLPARPGRRGDRAPPDPLARLALRAPRGRRRDDHDRRGDGQLRGAEVRARPAAGSRGARARGRRRRAGRHLRLRGGARRHPPRGGHARPRRRRRARDRGGRGAAAAGRRAARRPRARRRGRRAPARDLRDRGHDHDGLDRSAAGARRARARARPWFHVDAAYGGAVVLSDRPAAAARGHGARRLDRGRPAQVDVHAAVRRLRARPRLRAPEPLLPRRRLLHLARRRGPPGRRLRHARPAVLARLRGAEGLDLAARPRPGRLRAADRARHPAGLLPGRARGGARGVGAHVPAAALHLLLPPPRRPAGPARRRSSTATTSG